MKAPDQPAEDRPAAPSIGGWGAADAVTEADDGGLLLSDVRRRLRDHVSADRELSTLREIVDERARSRVLIEMAEHLSPVQLHRAFAIAREISDEEARRDALAAIAIRIVPGSEAGLSRRIAALAVQWARGQWSDRLLMLVSFALVAVAFAGLAWICWFWWLPVVWEWGFGRLTWASLVAPFAMIYLVIIPFAAVWLAPAITNFWAEFGALRQDVESARVSQQDIEQELREDDPQGLVLMLSYSRAVLSEYYAIAMSQAQRSFRYCLIAMWLGFAVLITGVLDSFLPMRGLLPGYLPPGTDGVAALGAGGDDRNTLVLLTGAVIEFIAAAFLWVYRFSIQQQTYYYRRQLSLHNALLAHRLATTMEAKDDSTKMIVERLLQDMEGPSSELHGSRGIMGLLKR